MIKRTPQEWADITGCYVVRDRRHENFTLFKNKPKINHEEGWWYQEGDWGTLPIGAVPLEFRDIDWTHLYCPHPDNKSEGCYTDQAESDNKAQHQSEVYVHAEYSVVHDISLSGLFSKVNDRINNGWKLQGGVAVEYLPESDGYKEGSEIFYQAMVRGV